MLIETRVNKKKWHFKLASRQSEALQSHLSPLICLQEFIHCMYMCVCVYQSHLVVIVVVVA